MPRPLNIIDLAITEEVSTDAAEVARRLDRAADLVADFAADAALNALDGLLALAPAPPRPALEGTRPPAADVTQQAALPHSEGGRFPAVPAGQRPTSSRHLPQRHPPTPTLPTPPAP